MCNRCNFGLLFSISMVGRMFLCVHLHTQDCPVTRDEMMVAVSWMSSVVTPLKPLCDFSTVEAAINATLKSKDQLTADQMKTRMMEAFREQSVRAKGRGLVKSNILVSLPNCLLSVYRYLMYIIIYMYICNVVYLL